MFIRTLTISCFGLLFLSGTSGQLAVAHEVEQPNTTIVHMYDDRYEPRDVTITAGDTIIFENESTMVRWPASNIHPTHRGYPGSDIDDCDSAQERHMFDACREIAVGSTYTFTFTEPGTWPYHDHINPRITGTITVEPAPEVVVATDWWSTLRTWWFNFWAEFLGAPSDREEIVTGSTNKTERVYDETIPEVTDTIAIDSDALYSHVRKFGAEASLAQLTALEPKYGSCHDPAHDVGRFTFEVYGENAFTKCSMGCHSGCYHGAVEAYFREYGTSNLKTDIDTICAASPNNFVSHQCHHGLGHGLMAWSNYQLFTALEGCDLLENKGSRESCYSGVFMENIVQSMASFLDIEGHTTEYISDDPHYPCTIVGDKYEPYCYFLQTDRMIQLADGNLEMLVDTCSAVENDYSRTNCFTSLGRTVSGQNQKQPEHIINTCNLIQNADNREQCLIGAIHDTFWDVPGKEDGLIFCSLLTTKRDTDLCYNLLIARAPVILEDTDSRLQFFSEVPAAYQNQCRASIQAFE